MTNNLDGMFELVDANTAIAVSDGRKMTTLKIGKWKVTSVDSEGRTKKITLTYVSYVPDMMVNLFSLTTVLEKGFSVVGTKEGIDIKKGDWKIKFDKRIGTPKGHVFGIKLCLNDESEKAQVSLDVKID